MDYQKTITVSHDGQKAFEFAQSIFVQNNFSLKKIGSEEVEFTGPGMHSTHENPLTGVAKARIKWRGKTIQLEANLGGVKMMQWFLFLFPPCLGLFLFTIFYLVHHSIQSALPALYAVSPWIVIGPLMGRWIKNRTLKALDVLLENTAQHSE